MTTLIASADTLLKKQPVLGDYLPDNQKVKVKVGKVYRNCKVLKTEASHIQVELADGAGTWWLWSPHWSGFESADVTGGAVTGVKLDVPYQSQRDNYRDASRTCFSSSCAMLVMALKPGKIKNDNEYVAEVFKRGDSTNSSIQLQVLDHFGIKAEFRQDGSQGKLKAQLRSGIPVPCGILHHGAGSAPTGGGHWICVVGYQDDKTYPGGGYYWVHDPWGEIDNATGTYPITDGKYRKYSYKLMDQRWTVDSADRDGWWIRAYKT
jgi:hypothetical protein